MLFFRFFIAFLLAQSLLFASNASPASQGEEIQLCAEIKKEIAQGSFDRNKEEQYGKQLRKIMFEKRDCDLMVIGQTFLDIRQNIRREFPEVTDPDYEKAHRSVGIALDNIDVMIREAYCNSAAAHMMLNIKYRYSNNSDVRYSSKILDFNKKTAEEGSPRSQFEYGQILLQGWGVKANIKEGLKFLEASADAGLDEANLEISEYYYRKDDKKFEKYLRRAAKSELNAQAMYNLGVWEQEHKKYTEAVQLFEKVIKLEPDYYAAKLELGRMYMEGWGVKKDPKKGAALISEVAEKSDEPGLKAVACMNIGIFYRQGIGVAKSIAESKKYFTKALELGYKDAEKYLKELENQKTK